MPNLFSVSGYLIYFWSNENNEPIHGMFLKEDLLNMQLNSG
ncbi:hypothetical protein IMAU60211_01036 [Lactobacillus helveticus]|uniref:Uncharacterized protein n=1 Tax=Lactobacillus helveticus TaxID=1587 RepID=A0A9Q5C9V3_LACHE|nr:hypothetical protein [Lactobacillus helveticus]NRO08695.1 hypothetical protein [Lactobacillus helveticus]NRO32935.1 hypothetical protein [Lactobacillus helveticus]NRO34836.1 hypothetical protein [Lactobacillus helveticus]NRO41058.1 hypothetical protein [Lactobacillus helveticus]NRO60604.1 hypothetical protein [Lactobacillus helveticus]